VSHPSLFDTGCPIPPRDTERICSQQARVRALMQPGVWWTLSDLAREVGASEAGASARIRDLRKFPSYLKVSRKRLPGSNLYAYAVEA